MDLTMMTVAETRLLLSNEDPRRAVRLGFIQ